MEKIAVLADKMAQAASEFLDALTPEQRSAGSMPLPNNPKILSFFNWAAPTTYERAPWRILVRRLSFTHGLRSPIAVTSVSTTNASPPISVIIYRRTS